MGVNQPQQPPQATEKDRWIQRMLRSARTYHKLCPYFDKKTQQCFIKLGEECDRDGKYDTCPVFIDFLSQKYTEYASKGRPLPTDFLDISR
jgi:hypothetical protein